MQNIDSRPITKPASHVFSGSLRKWQPLSRICRILSKLFHSFSASFSCDMVYLNTKQYSRSSRRMEKCCENRIEPISTRLAAIVDRCSGRFACGACWTLALCSVEGDWLVVRRVTDFCGVDSSSVLSLKVKSGALQTCKNGKGQSKPNLWHAAKNYFPLISKLFLALVMLYK